MFSSDWLETFSFATPLYLWLLAVPGVMLVLWTWRVLSRRRDIARLRRARIVPQRERFGAFGDLAFWFCALTASAICIVALAGPRARVNITRNASADVVILQDGSASMYVRDVAPDRWRRSVRFLRTFAETLSWKGDRVALALFANLCSPQVRLTRDPNALFFFLDHLGERSPFRLEDLPTWDTNIEEGIRWGLRIVETDDQLFGNSGNPRAFLVVTDGQAWSGTVANALRRARERRIPVFIVGVGTTSGGLIPQPKLASGEVLAPVHSVLDRSSLIQLAQAGGGEYFEIGRGSDRDLAFTIISRLRRLSNGGEVVESFEDLYWRFLLAAAIVIALGMVLLHSRTELAWGAVGAACVVLMLTTLL